MRTRVLTEEKLYLLAFLSNLLIFLLEIVGFVFSVKNQGWKMFLYYTVNSNILLFLSSFFALLSVYFNVRKGCGTNYLSHLFRWVATAASTLTLFVVLFVLMPLHPQPWRLLFCDAMLFQHTLCPVISLISFLFFEKEESRNLRYAHLPLTVVFTLLYGVLFAILNALSVVKGPYPFLDVHSQSVLVSVLWFFAIIGLACLLSILLAVGNKKIFKRGIIYG